MSGERCGATYGDAEIAVLETRVARAETDLMNLSSEVEQVKDRIQRLDKDVSLIKLTVAFFAAGGAIAGNVGMPIIEAVLKLLFGTGT